MGVIVGCLVVGLILPEIGALVGLILEGALLAGGLILLEEGALLVVGWILLEEGLPVGLCVGSLVGGHAPTHMSGLELLLSLLDDTSDFLLPLASID